jgi:hypothetical protein
MHPWNTIPLLKDGEIMMMGGVCSMHVGTRKPEHGNGRNSSIKGGGLAERRSDSQ